MRLDHLLSKEKEEVGVVLLSSCQGVHAAEDIGRQTDTLAWMDAWKWIQPSGDRLSLSLMRSIDESERRSTHGRTAASNFRWRVRKAHRCRVHYNLIFPVAMRLGDTPVLIPNTMVKT